MKRVLLDAGHGGNDPGAVVDGIREADINLDVTMALGWFLRRRGFETRFTRVREESQNLSARLRMIRESKPSAFVSIHSNAIAGDPETPADERALVRGFEVYYRDAGDKPLADAILHYMKRTNLKSRGVRQDIDWLNKRLMVLNDLQVPAVLVELGYISNNIDRSYILHHTEALGNLIGQGVIDFLGGESDGPA